MNVPFFRADLDGNELQYVKEVLESGWLTTGPKTAAFESNFAESVGARHAIAVNSCTAALHLACEAAGVGPGSNVLVPSLTFTATAEVVEHLGGAVRLADIDLDTGLLGPEQLTSALERYPDISCVIPVHFGGQAVAMRGTHDNPGVMDICEQRNITVIEDAAQAFPANHDCGTTVGGAIGSTATCFSFYANKTITTGEGGLVTTNDDEIAARIRSMRFHGIDRSTWDRLSATNAQWEYDVIAAGYKYNLPDITAAIGLAQLERAREFRNTRARLVEEYHELLSNADGVRITSSRVRSQDHAWHLFIIHLDPNMAINRNVFIEKLNAKGIGTSVHYKPLHRMSYWDQRTDADVAHLPNAEAWWQNCVSLPLYPSMTENELDAVSQAVHAVLAEQRQAIS